MSAASSIVGATLEREIIRVVPMLPEGFGPDDPLVWWYGRLRYPTESGVYRLTHWREAIRHWWYDVGRQPCVSSESRPVFPDDRASRGSYAAARLLCRTPNCYLRALPFGREPFGDELFDNPTFIRPLVEPERDERFASIYTRTLADFICSELSKRNRELTRELEAVRLALEEDYE